MAFVGLFGGWRWAEIMAAVATPVALAYTFSEGGRASRELAVDLEEQRPEPSRSPDAWIDPLLAALACGSSPNG